MRIKIISKLNFPKTNVLIILLWGKMGIITINTHLSAQNQNIFDSKTTCE